MQLIVLSGLPGSGKSTLAEGLSHTLSRPIFSVDPIEAAMWQSGLARESTGIAAYDVAIRLGTSICDWDIPSLSTPSTPSRRRERPGEILPRNTAPI